MAIASKLPGTENDKEQMRKAVDNLKKIYQEKKKKEGLNQTKLAKLMGIKQQSAISQYFLEKIDLNIVTVINFAEALEVSPLEIWPELMQRVYDSYHPTKK